MVLLFGINYQLLIVNYQSEKCLHAWEVAHLEGVIIINPELIKAPKGCIEYVIIHELCHLTHHDHTQKFIDLQTKAIKDWAKWKMKREKLLA